MTDIVQIRALRTVGRHGVLGFEKEHPQPFEVDIDIETDLRLAGVTDVLGDTVDYGDVAKRVSEIVAGENYELLERLAQRIADEVLADQRVVAVDITVKKLRPTIPVDLANVGVRIRRP